MDCSVVQAQILSPSRRIGNDESRHQHVIYSPVADQGADAELHELTEASKV